MLRQTTIIITLIIIFNHTYDCMVKGKLMEHKSLILLDSRNVLCYVFFFKNSQ